MAMRVVYFGSPQFAVPPLEALAAAPNFEVVLVVTQGAKEPSPVELAAQRLGLQVYKPATLRDANARAPLVEADADLFVVAAFGLIFRQRTLDIPRLGSINIHPSLLPRYRGATPIMASILCGDAVTGVSLMEMDTGIDTGAVISTEQVVVASNDTTATLAERLAATAAAQVVRDIPRWVRGELAATPQGSDGASLTRPLHKADGAIDWSRPAPEIERFVRAMWPWPRAWTTVDGATMQIHGASIIEDEPGGRPPGTVLPVRKRLVVACGQGALELTTIEPAGRRTMTGAAYLNGLRAPIERVGQGIDASQRDPLVKPLAFERADGVRNADCG